MNYRPLQLDKYLDPGVKGLWLAPHWRGLKKEVHVKSAGKVRYKPETIYYFHIPKKPKAAFATKVTEFDDSPEISVQLAVHDNVWSNQLVVHGRSDEDEDLLSISIP
ncbi:MAG: hypothetical protein AAFY91_14755, partial [Bacteroidota bacterium]